MPTSNSDNNDNNNSGAPAAPVAAHLDPLAVSAEVEKLAGVACHDLGLDRATLNEQQLAKLTERARVNLIKRQTEGDSKTETERLRTENRALEARAAALRSVKSSDARDFRPAINCAQAERAVGRANWVHKMSDEERVKQLGIDPATVDWNLVSKLFGKDADGAFCNRFAMSEPGRYRVYREISEAARKRFK